MGVGCSRPLVTYHLQARYHQAIRTGTGTGRPPPPQPRRGTTPPLPRTPANGRTAHPCRTHSGANCTTTAAATAGERKSNGQCGYQQCESQTSRVANDHGALLSVDPQIMWGACPVARWTSTESDRSSRISNRAASWRAIDEAAFGPG